MTNKAATLAVFDIERFAVHDGPGIRSTVFLQGCPLCCPWCANPESQLQKRQLMHFANRCVGCGACAGVCAAGCITLQNGLPVFAREACTACGRCEAVCLEEALQLVGGTRRLEDVLTELSKDSLYYTQSGGGVTLSGGEPLAQPEGALALLAACRERGWHTAVETTGQADEKTFKQVANSADLLLFDVKHFDAGKLRKTTGGRLELILPNLTYAAKHCAVVARVPVIPGFNHSGEDMHGIFALLQKAGVQTVQLLPYHTLGAQKYARLGLRYALEDSPMLAKEDLQPYAALGAGYGLLVQVGG